MRITRYQRPDLNAASPFDQWFDLRDEINRLFDLPLGSFHRDTEFLNSWAPLLDVFEDRDQLIVKTELPGMYKEDIDISLHENNLTISGERKMELQEGQKSRAETFFGRFQRTFSLPRPVDPNKVSATYKDGVLTILLPKTEESKPKQIQVSTN